MEQRDILLIVTGGIAAYKTPELVRQLVRAGLSVRVVMTDAAHHFVTPLALASVSGAEVHHAFFNPADEMRMGHIALSRSARLILVAPATADFLAKIAHGAANDLASTVVLATDKPVMVAPAMNVRMLAAKPTQRNFAQLRYDGVTILPTDEGTMACGEYGPGRLLALEKIVAAAKDFLDNERTNGSLQGRHAIVTAGPTIEPIDPVRFISNRSSGKQGYALAESLARAGATVTLISGPTSLPCPNNVTRVNIQTAEEMLTACMSALPADIFCAVAAVADWRPTIMSAQKLKGDKSAHAHLSLTENPDILAKIAKNTQRPTLVVGFAAETDNILEYARAKRIKKGADWIIANDVSGGPDKSVMGSDENAATIITENGEISLSMQSKQSLADEIAARISAVFADIRG